MTALTVQDVERVQEAKTCKGCLGWLHHCHAECCKSIKLNIDPKILEGAGEFISIRVGKNFSASDQWYYKLHNVHYTRGILKFKKSRIKVFGNLCFYLHPCEKLDGDLCSGHPDNKPKLCKFLNEETSKLKNAGFELTDNCLFKYK